jgi:hypothetical protein
VNKLILLLSAVIFMAIQGCAMFKPIPLEEVRLGQTNGTKVLIVNNQDYDGKEIDKSVVMDEIKEIMEKSGEFNNYSKWKKYDSPTTRAQAAAYDVRGSKVSFSDNDIIVEYINGNGKYSYSEYSQSTGKTIDHGEYSSIYKTEAKFPYRIVKDGKFYKVTIDFPVSLLNHEHYSWDKPIGTFEQIINDLNSKFTGLINPVLRSSTKVNGELNCKYNSDSIYSNFERLFGKFEAKDSQITKDDLEKKNVFKFDYGGSTLPIFVSVFPYRDGSKINYEVSIPYTIGTDYSIDPNKIASVKKRVAAIAND